MQKRHYFKIVLLMGICSLAAVLAGCSKDDEVANNTWNGEIRLASGIAIQTRVHQDLQSSQLEAGNLVGVCINEHGGASTTYTQNLEYYPTGSGHFMNPPTVYFPSSGNPVSIYAYAPRNEDWNDLTKTYPFSVKPNQYAKANYLASDLLWGEPMSADATPQKLNPVARTKEEISLNFRHLLSKVRVTLANGAGLTNEDVIKIELLDLLPSTDLKMADGTISAAKGSKGNVALFDADYEIITSASAVVVPQTVNSGSKFLRFGLADGGELFYTLPKKLTMESGKIYDFTITMNLTGLTVTSTVTDWTMGESFTGGAEMPGPIGSKKPADAVVGDFYFKDGTLEDKGATLTDDQKAACVGIVYQKSADGKGGKVVGKNETALAWSTEEIETGATSETDGAANTAKIIALPSYNATTYPAFAWCVDQGTGWYLPASNDLSTLYTAWNTNRDAFNMQLTTSGGTVLTSDEYWTSAEYDNTNGELVSFSAGDRCISFKVSPTIFRVRCVKAF